MKTKLLISLVAVALIGISCEKSTETPYTPISQSSNSDLIAADDAKAIFENLEIPAALKVEGTPPLPGDAGSVPVITTPSKVFFGPNGSSFQFKFTFSDLTSSGRAETVNIWTAFEGAYWEAPILDNHLVNQEYSTVISLPDNMSEGNFDIYYSITDSDGNTSKVEKQDVYVDYIGHGDLIISLSWEGIADLDLQVTEPDGTTLDYINRQSGSGGVFTGDQQNGNYPETIVYSTEPPNGDYSIRIGFYDRQNQQFPIDRSAYLLTLQIDGRPVTFDGVVEKGESYLALQFTKTDKNTYDIADIK